MKKTLILLLFISSSTRYNTTFCMNKENSSLSSCKSSSSNNSQSLTLLQEIKEHHIYKSQKLKHQKNEIEEFNTFIAELQDNNSSVLCNKSFLKKQEILISSINNNIFEHDNEAYINFLNQTLKECILEQSNCNLIKILSKINQYTNKIILPQEINDLICKQNAMQTTETQSYNAIIFSIIKIHLKESYQNNNLMIKFISDYLKQINTTNDSINLSSNHQHIDLSDDNNYQMIALQYIHNKLTALLPQLNNLLLFIELATQNNHHITTHDTQQQQ